MLTILEAIEKIKIYSSVFNDAITFYESNDQKEFNAVLNLLIAIGEEAKKIDDNLKADVVEIDWIAIVGLRNKLSHDYRGVDIDIVWDIVRHYLDPLKLACIKVLQHIDFDIAKLNKILSSSYYKNIRYLTTIL